MASNPTDFSQTVSRATICVGHVLDVLKTIPDESVHCVVTSPPYWGLRDYKLVAQIWDGEMECSHQWEDNVEKVSAGGGVEGSTLEGGKPHEHQRFVVPSSCCQKCDAWRGSLGLEPTFDLYVHHLVEVFRGVRRVLRDDGTLWLNLGDSYASTVSSGQHDAWLKPKDLVGIPWRVAFALQADGWWLRSDIIWSKPNPMPESVTDRPTKAHEYLFLLAKAERYYYDTEAIQEPSVGEWNSSESWAARENLTAPELTMGADRELMRTRGFGTHHPDEVQNVRNKRTVWEIPTEAFSHAHFATFPQALVFPCILAGCPIGGTVLDPFAGSGTTLLVAAKNGRNSIGIDLQPDYIPLMRQRLAPLEADLVQPLEVVIKSATDVPVDAAVHGAVVAGGPTPILAEPEENQRPPTWPEGQLALFP